MPEPYRKGNFSCPLLAISSSPCAHAHGEWKLGWSGRVERVMALDTSYAKARSRACYEISDYKRCRGRSPRASRSLRDLKRKIHRADRRYGRLLVAEVER